jgi:Holliday junction resolvasome RuvABC endonuclease subunit
MQTIERTTKPEYRILANDPSFTAWGWAVVNQDGIVRASGCIVTKKDSKKRRIRVSDDRTRRALEITQELIRLVKKYNITFMVCEALSGSQNASAAVMIGAVLGISVAICECLGIPIEYYSEGDAKKAVLHKQAATKEEMIAAIDKLYGVYWTDTKYVDEAVADALAIHYVASLQSPTLKMMRQ